MPIVLLLRVAPVPRLERAIRIDSDDLDTAFAELDRLHADIEADDEELPARQPAIPNDPNGWHRSGVVVVRLRQRCVATRRAGRRANHQARRAGGDRTHDPGIMSPLL